MATVGFKGLTLSSYTVARHTPIQENLHASKVPVSAGQQFV